MGIFSRIWKSATLAPLTNSAPAIIPRSSFWDMLTRGVSSSGVNIDQTSAMSLSPFYAAQKAISESLAILPRDMFEKLGKGQREEVDNHPSLKILQDEFNPLMTSVTGFQTLQHHALLSGNGYAEIQFRSGTGYAVALWPIPPGQVTPKIIQSGDMLDLVYEVKLPNGADQILRKDQVLHIPGLGFDGISGYPTLQVMLNALGLTKALEDYGSYFFKNGADVAGYMTIPDDFTEDQIINLRRHNEERNTGLSNAHRWKFLFDSVKFTPTSMSPTDAQMMDSRVFQIQEVARFFRIPLHKLQETSNSPSYNSLEQYQVEFVNDTLLPWVCRWEQELKRKLFTEPTDSRKYIKFNLNALLRGDSLARANFYRTMIMSGVMTRNEARAREDLPPIEGADELLVPLNMESADKSDREMDAEQRIAD